MPKSQLSEEELYYFAAAFIGLLILSQSTPVKTFVDQVGSLIRGIRNNNPGNIEFDPKVTWIGQIGSDGRFIIFDTPQNGIRALGIILINYQRLHNLQTLRQIGERFAPQSENPGTPRGEQLARMLNLNPDQPINVFHYLVPLVSATIKLENGINPYPDELIQTASATATSRFA